MWDEIDRLLRGIDEETRRQGWQRLHSVVTANHLPGPAELRRFLDRLRSEDDDDNWRIGVAALLRAAVERAAPAGEESPPRDATLGEWLWGPFRRDSQVLRVVDPQQRKRDEDAVIVLARHLALREFPRTRFERVHPGAADWDLVRATCGAVCVVGRLGLYGEHALTHWKKTDLRFNFVSDFRPPDLKPGQLDGERYHCIRERIGSEPANARRYPTEDREGERIDHGLVQRYVVTYRAYSLVVLHCAGGSSLGTLGAVQWAAGDIRPEGQDAEKDRIPPAPGLGPSSRLEALVRVTAQQTPYPASWRGARAELVSLYADDHVWSAREGRWVEKGPEEITLILAEDDRSQVVDVELDGVRTTMRKEGQSYRLLVQLCRMAQERGGAVDPATLAQDTTIWGNVVDFEKANDAINNLKSRTLKGALSSDHRRLLARVTAR